MVRSSSSLSPGVMLTCLFGAFALSACATATPYQPIASASRAEGGYTSVQLAPDRWQVTFSGNSLTSRETVEGYLLYRAAELTLEQGGSWFEIARHDLEHEIRETIVPDPGYDPWWGYPRWRPSWHYYGQPHGWRSWYPGAAPFFDTQRIERYEARAEIVIHHGPQPRTGDQLFDAAEVVDRLGPTIKRPK